MIDANAETRPLRFFGDVVTARRATGLSLVYASAYFLPQSTSTQAYMLASLNVFKVIILPSIITVAAGSVMILLLAMAARIRMLLGWRIGGSIVVLSVLSVLALKSIAEAAGIHWQDAIPRGRNLLATQQLFKLSVFVAVFLLVYLQRHALPRLVRILSSLGFAFGVLAILRLLTGFSGHATTNESEAVEPLPVQVVGWHVADGKVPQVAHEGRPRRVVWVIFDETDYDLLFKSGFTAQEGLSNFAALENSSVFATNANSPASATLYSIPALLSGVPISGKGVRIDRSGLLSLEESNGQLIEFNERSSVFGVLRSLGLNASVLGFLHPYCSLFDLHRCESLVWPEVGSVRAAATANLPDRVADYLHGSDYWSDITRTLVQRLPVYLDGEEALTFIHLNVPHLPANYADSLERVRPSADPLEEYSRNLKMTDKLLGEIVRTLTMKSAEWNLLLVVSTDHWLRNRWYQADMPELSRPIPLLMWKVGETRGIKLEQPLSTVNTSHMIVDFLQGAIDDQTEIAGWWKAQPTYSSFIAPGT